MDPRHLHNVSGRSMESKPPSGEPHTKLGTLDFVDLLGTKAESYYIDKTELIEVFLKCKRNRVLVTGPRRSGKTINIAMLKTFFELQVPTEQIKMSEENLQINIKSTKNYKLFHEHGLIITKHSDLMKKHFGKYPVLNISFNCHDPMESFNDVFVFCTRLISQTFQKHGYLESSTALKPWEKNTCTKWYSGKWNINESYDRQEVSSGLQTLAMYLYKHFGKKVVLLIDDYDSVIIQAMLNLKCVDELEKVIPFCTGIIQAAVKENVGDNWIEYAFITGISHLSGMGLSGSNVKPFRFLENHSFVPYYGLTANEVQQLLQTTYKFKEQIDHVRMKCIQYTSRSFVRIYNIWSVLEWTGKYKQNFSPNIWQDTGYIVGFKQACRFPVIIMEKFENGLRLNQPILLNRVECAYMDDVLNLAKIIGQGDPRKVKHPSPELFFSFMLEQGYLSYVRDRTDLFIIPHEQIKMEIKQKLTDFKTNLSQ